MLRAIVFDFDGVIANSEPLHFAAFRDVLAGEGIALTEADYYARYLGYDDVGMFQAIGAARGGWAAAEIAGLVARKAVRLEELERHVSVLFPGAADAIRRAAAAVPLRSRRARSASRSGGCSNANVWPAASPRSCPPKTRR